MGGITRASLDAMSSAVHPAGEVKRKREEVLGRNRRRYINCAD
jgi:hypothetical protein